ncbi:MAG: ABC transporter substrate-binding protein [Acutalibacteraceae bacterium]
MKIKRIAGLMCAGLMLGTLLTSCGEKDKKTVRYLNFKPENAAIYEEIAAEYEKETGVHVIVETAANNQYESTLTAKMSTSEAPTIFQINGPKGYANWSDYCEDLSDSELYKHLTDKSIAIESNGKVYGIPYVVEGYGIIYNKAITDQYFSSNFNKSGLKSMDEIKSFSALKTVVEDMQKNRQALGIEGVFASTSLKSGEDWRWQTHLANIPIYYEFSENNTDLTGSGTDKISFKYADNYRNIFDLYINNSTTDKKLLGSKLVDESMAEFALGKCAMVQNGNWAYGQISKVQGNTVKAENIKFMPIYTGMTGEENQGICIGTENFYAINAKADENEKKLALDFLYWLYSSDKGKEFVTTKLGFIAPFDTFKEGERPTDPLAVEVLRWMESKDHTTIPWNFTIFPSQKFKENFGSMLLSYAQGTKTWDDVKNRVVSDWESESKAAKH